MTVIKNVKLSCNQEKPDSVVVIDDEGVTADITDKVPEAANDEVIDGEGNILYPGLWDIHTHGAKKIDCSTASAEEIASLEDWYSSCGVTSWFPTTATMSLDDVLHAVENVKKASELVTKAQICGIHIEGPFLSYERRGAHNEKLLEKPNTEFVSRVLEKAGGLKVRITVAPELEGGEKFVEFCTEKGVEVTMGHSVADADTCMRAIKKGSNCVTHTFNGMNQLHHRNPGVLGTALAEDIYAEIICDGIHVDKTVVKLFSKAKGADRAVLITDSVMLCGCNEGESVLNSGGMEERVIDGKIMNVENGCLAGSSLRLCDGVKNYMNFTGVSLDDSIKCASENPAKCVYFDAEKIKIKIGNFANLTVFSSDGELQRTIFKGRTVYKKA